MREHEDSTKSEMARMRSSCARYLTESEMCAVIHGNDDDDDKHVRECGSDCGMPAHLFSRDSRDCGTYPKEENRDE